MSKPRVAPFVVGTSVVAGALGVLIGRGLASPQPSAETRLNVQPVSLGYPSGPSVPPAAKRPASCEALLKTTLDAAHWERQQTLLNVEVDESPILVPAVRADLFANNTLPTVAAELREFAAPLPIAIVQLHQPLNQLPAGRYCMTAQLLDVAAPDERESWQTLLFDAEGPNAEARAVVPFLARTPWSADAHTGTVPYPRVRWQFVQRADVGAPSFSKPKGTVSLDPITLPGEALTQWLAVSTWWTCGDGCCTGALEALQFLQ